MNASNLTHKDVGELKTFSVSKKKGNLNETESPKEQKIVIEKRYINPVTKISTMLLTMPFQPSIWDEKLLKTNLQNSLQYVNEQMKGEFSTDCMLKLTERLELQFKKLNLNTHRKGLAILIRPEEEKILYLNFPVKTTLIFKRDISVLDYAASVLDSPAFFYLILNADGTRIYEFHNQRLWKIYEQLHETSSVLLLKNLTGIFDQLNFDIDKPVFTTGEPNLHAQFCESVYYRDSYFALTYEKTDDQPAMAQAHVDEITGRWEFWKSKYLLKELQMAQQAGTLIEGVEPVMQALNRGGGGILLIDTNIEQYLKGSSGDLDSKNRQLLKLVEHFLVEGHLIEKTTGGLLEAAKGIALISNSLNYSNSHFNNRETGSCSGGELF